MNAALGDYSPSNLYKYCRSPRYQDVNLEILYHLCILPLKINYNTLLGTRYTMHALTQLQQQSVCPALLCPSYSIISIADEKHS